MVLKSKEETSPYALSPVVRSVIHFIKKGYQAGQAQLVPCKFMLTTANHLALNTFGNVSQRKLLYNLPRDQGEATKSVFSWALILLFLEEKSDICFLPVLRKLPQSP